MASTPTTPPEQTEQTEQAEQDEQCLVTLELSGLGRLGEAMADLDGKPVYVFGGIPGETVVAEIIRERRGYLAAQVVQVVTPSKHRVEPPCGYFGACTGCQWQHVSYERQLEIKREIVVDALERIGGLDGSLVQPTLPSPEPLGYRNHARFTVSPAPGAVARSAGARRRRGARRNAPPSPTADAVNEVALGDGRLGYVHREKRRHVEIDECLLMAPWINGALAELQGHVAETTQLSLRCGINTDSWMLQPTFHSTEVSMESGQKHYEESLLGHRFQVSSPSFFQVNTHQAEQMAERVMAELQLTGTETVVDAYAGVATFAVLLSPHAGKVIAVEESASALVDARVNVEGIANIELRQSRTEDALMELAAAGIDAVVLDPPRSGCMPGTLEALVAAPPRRIVYVSCDPETLARDLAVLTAGPFRIDSVLPIDMFPQTHHVESLTVLSFDEERNAELDARRNLVLASASPRRNDILTRLGLEFDLAPSDAPEPDAEPGQTAEQVAGVRALAKARASAVDQARGTVIGADTVVELDGTILGKPADADEARTMLKALRGREHRVITAVALVDAATGASEQQFRASRVVMREYSDEEIDAYIASGDPFDKAGAYAVQSESFAPASEVRGCYLNVVGLPVCALLKAAERFGVQVSPVPELPWPELERCPECAKRTGAA
jgi:23S rRNA (uracil1939-C5)-methyltransferase